MGRTVASLPGGIRVSDRITLGVVAKTFPSDQVHAVLEATKRGSVRERDLPAHVMVYYAIALALHTQVSYREVLRWLLEGLSGLGDATVRLKVASKGGISRARTRLGWEPLRALHDAIVKPIAVAATKGAWYQGWRLVSLDGSTLDIADSPANEKAFGRPGSKSGRSAYPQLRFVCLVENGPHVMFGSRIGAYRTGETTLAKSVLGQLQAGMLCLADRLFFGFEFWNLARASGADLLWRVKTNIHFECDRRLPDGSYLSRIYAGARDRRRQTNGVRVRVVEYCLQGVEKAEPMYRLVTTLLEPDTAPAHELAALYHERWEIETVLDELKSHLRGAKIVLRSQTPDLVIQEFYGLVLAHFAIRGLMHEAALKANEDPDRLSFIHVVRIVRRKLPSFHAIPPSAPESISRGGVG